MIGFRLIVRCIKGRKSFRNALDSVACSKVILLASGTRFAYRTTIVTILLRCCFSLAFMRKKLCLCVAYNEYEFRSECECANEFEYVLNSH